MKKRHLYLLGMIALVSVPEVYGQSSCAPTTAQADLDINNVRTTILVGGDMWWNLTSAKYEIPKGSGKHSLYAGSLWIGGYDATGNLKVAAQTYRQLGGDFWGGPLDTTAVNITPAKCQEYDRHWKVTRQDVVNFIEDPSTATNDITNWPGNGDPGSNEGNFLAPYVDVNGDGTYNHQDGDYPGYKLSGGFPTVPGTSQPVCNDYLFGDQTIWWVFNDVGNIHASETDPIGLEIRAQAYGFQTNDEINNMTFYKYQIINRSTYTLYDTYFGQWTDPDLGYSDDDYVGCDVKRGLGFCYNGDSDDETATGYGLNPPAIGIDFFQGPAADLNDSTDNDRDGCIDCTFQTDTAGNVSIIDDDVLREEIIMSKFVYYNNINNSPVGNPVKGPDFYNYLRGRWIDGQPITFGGNGRDINNPVCNFMFPGNTDSQFAGQNWSEFSVNNPVGDRRFIQSAGTFTLEPGAVNYITTGVVWARAFQGGALASVDLLKSADDKAQALFDNCFELTDGPDAPDVAIRELNQTIILTLIDTKKPEIEEYHEKDPTIIGYADSLTYYNFQGYQIFQFRDASVTVTDIGNPDKVRLVGQCDIKDGVVQLVNFTFDPALNANIATEMVNGNDKGVLHTFKITQDLFATGNTALINHKTYFYSVLSYASNGYKRYDPSDPASLDGQKKPYLAGRNNVKTYSAIPHDISPEVNGTLLNSAFGEGVYIKRIEGSGNGGMLMDMTEESVNELLAGPAYKCYQPVYKPLEGPVNIKIFDALQVKPLLYRMAFDGTGENAGYQIALSDNSKVIPSDYSLKVPDEKLVPEWGLSFMATMTIEPGDTLDPKNGLLGSFVEYENPQKKWFNPLKDVDDINNNPADWIRSGKAVNDPYPKVDNQEAYENVAGGTWAPYKLVSKDTYHPRWGSVGEINISLTPNATTNTSIQSVDIVFTSDQSKWTRCSVIETGNNNGLTIGNAKQFDLRKSPSIGKDGSPDFSVSATGMSWFPGYAFNVETGERLNIAFGENSSLLNDRSTDMKFNPTHRIYDDSGNVVLGGMHFIYIFGHNGNELTDMPHYDEGRFMVEKLSTLNSNDKRQVWKNAMWTNIPMLSADFKNIDMPAGIPSDIRIKIRVARNYHPYAATPQIKSAEALVQGSTYYVASVPVTHNGITYNIPGESFVASSTSFTGPGTLTESAPQNQFNPLYEFGTSEQASTTGSHSVAESAMDMINIVPNPYYAYSSYETSQLDNRVKITNLPPRCVVTILTQNGTLIRRFKRDTGIDQTEGTAVNPKSVNAETSIEWDLKNQRGIPIASGLYIIHIDAGELGSKTLKWFGILRPIDLDTF